MTSHTWVEGRTPFGRCWQLNRPSGGAKVYEHDGGFVLAVEHGKRHAVHRTETLEQAKRYAEDRLATWETEDDLTSRARQLAHDLNCPGAVPGPSQLDMLHALVNALTLAETRHRQLLERDR